MKIILVEQAPTPEQQQALNHVEQILSQVNLELVGTRPKNR